MQLKLSIVIVLLGIAGCRGATDSDSDVLAFTENVGTLYLDPTADPHFSEGVVQYRIYDNGDIRYSGDVTYAVHPGVTLTMQVPFDGTLHVAPATIHSATYAQAGASLVEGAVGFSVATASQGAATVKAAIANASYPDSPDMTGVAALDITKSMIAIVSADVTGTVFYGTPAATKVRVLLKNTPPAQ